ncbi:hypothetical protein AMS68_002349 [Peltaster fructicola]|uniref:Xylulose kinase n=1 Tax=Peltaster fructicola TaxID=286661 RepID=A0A6H0XPZ4_9PEZI|nr:hypothetical protein AMS68_002349 [Peltaster fructicola]
MWLEAVDLVLSRLREQGIKFADVKGISGAGMQHGTVFWSEDAENILANLDASKNLVDQLQPGSKGERRGAFAHPYSPNWQDASTQQQCDLFDKALGSAVDLARVTGSKAHHRFSGPQILRYRTKYPKHYQQTARISLVSSFLASVFLGKIAPIDISDVTGMDLWDIHNRQWHDGLLHLTAGGDQAAAQLKIKLGKVSQDGGGSFGMVSKYFVSKYGFSSDAKVIPFTGDNPATILALPLRPSDAMVSLGTSTTFLMSTTTYQPDPEYHFMNHPTTDDHFMFMLCYKNGGLAREHVRDRINGDASGEKTSWDAFNHAALTTAPMAADQRRLRAGLYFPRPEIVPNVRAGQWRAQFDVKTQQFEEITDDNAQADARNIIESQMLSIRLRAKNLVKETKDPQTGKILPPQPRRIYLVGGGSSNPAIAQVCGEVLGSVEGVYKLDIGGNACALGAAYKAVWGSNRRQGESFESYIGARWDESKFVKRVANGYKVSVWH